MSDPQKDQRDALVAAWLAADPDEQLRDQLIQHRESETWLAEHFEFPLAFGTAGLRGQMGPGPARMNRLLVRITARALGLVLQSEALAERGVVIGFDARYGSREFAHDSAQVLAAMGIDVGLIIEAVPTPVLARQLLERCTGAGVMVTASHNPRDDNGYKVYWQDGTQIRPPIDELIEAQISAQLATAATGGSLIAEANLAPLHQVELIEPRSAIADYVGTVIKPFDAATANRPPLEVVYTALKGVGTSTLMAAFAVAGLAPPHLVSQQCAPDPSFEGLPFPNPEEPGTLDAATGLAQQTGVGLVLANDPDADRLAVAVRTESGWRRLTGDELGLLLCDHQIQQTPQQPLQPDSASPNGASPNGASKAQQPIAVSSVVSGTMVAALCAARGVKHHRTLTGFKWVMLPRLTQPEAAWVFGYEEALGYSVSDAVLDKDGIAAAVEFVHLAQGLAARDTDPLGRLDELALELGVFDTRQISVRTSRTAAADTSATDISATGRLRASPPTELSGSDGPVAVTQIEDWLQKDPPQRTDLLQIHLDTPSSDGPADRQLNRRISIRPSGTEPKVKLYLEVSSPGRVAPADLAELRSLCARELDGLAAAAKGWFE